MDEPIDSDRCLVGRFLQRSDEGSFRELYRRHTPAVYQLAARLVGGGGRGADDLVQEAWIRAVGRLSSFRWESSLRTWLSGIAINLYRESARRRDSSRFSQPREPSETPDYGRGEPASAIRMDLERAIARLPDGAREILLLHDLEGYTHDEIAALLGIHEGTSKSQLHKGRRALRVLLATLPRAGEET